MENTERPIKKRTRASVACNNCRIKRSKCDGAQVGTPCSQCKKSKLRCEIQKDGKRQRTPSRLQVEALTERVKQLEGLLQISESAAFPNGVATPDKQSIEPLPAPAGALTRASSEESEPDFSGADDSLALIYEDVLDEFQPGSVPSAVFDWSPVATNFAESAHVLQDDIHIGQKRSKHSFDEFSSIPTTGSALHGVPPTLIEHLLDAYFLHFQTMLKIVDEETFRLERASNGSDFRESLFLSMLAAGARFSSDPNLQDLRGHGNVDGENVFVSRAKTLLENELRDANIKTVQALLILGELETSAGNELTACMYSGLVSRLIFDLKLDPASSQEFDLKPHEVSVRHWLLWFSAVQDKYWALNMNRHLTIKTVDLQLSRMIAKFSKQTVRAETTFEDSIHEIVMDEMELAREATDFITGSHGNKLSIEDYSSMSRLSSNLDTWFNNLPQHMRQASIDANMFVFVLHMQYHLTKIQLHQPFAFPTRRGKDPMPPLVEMAMGRIQERCESVVASSAVKIAKSFETFRRKHDIRYLQSTGTQYATFAARALIRYVTSLPPDEAVEPEAHLQSLRRTLEEMRKTFKSAAKPLSEIDECLIALESRASLKSNQPEDLTLARSQFLQTSTADVSDKSYGLNERSQSLTFNAPRLRESETNVRTNLGMNIPANQTIDSSVNMVGAHLLTSTDGWEDIFTDLPESTRTDEVSRML